ncbi:DUF922 domain-containing protein [Mucilaginibacter sp. FT3.2]|uniref:DUF922 domain-containing protein n=1 Tax=Mucilaginibacter sp. FT3.2 TaxID=2723090 RepID=UPI00160E5836|nr:DUF922 domain-containing protein [Mucilaginibacter sp. FT3.2]MBB6230570.1 hypothetical protein [Mucilaginibacter sp. FT3.2]
MKVRLVKWIGATAICLITIGANAQQYQQYHPLTINDFLGTPRANAGGVVAYTNCTIDFKYEASNRTGSYILNATVNLVLNNYKSWLDRSRVLSKDVLAEILKHEQGHYLIAYLEQQEILRQISKTRFTYNYRNEAMALFNRIDAKYKQLNTDYDDDTAHMTNRQQQRNWDQYFKKRLEFEPQE